jgi:prepilin-type N-terminal cleavage/methylation domain-containing protein
MTLALGGAAGFTIIEVMVVLAVTGFMFLAALEATNGQISQATFTSGLSQLASQIQDGADQVENGSYSNVPLATCVPPGIGSTMGVQVSFPNGSAGQGSNSHCVFAGTLFQFVPAGSSGDYEQLSLAASRTCPNGAPLVLYCYDEPTPFGGTGIGPIEPNPNLTVQNSVPDNLTIQVMGYTDTISGHHYLLTTHTTGTNVLFGFVQNFGLGLGQSGSQGSPYIVYYSASSSLSPASADNAVNGANLAQASEVCIGLSDGQQYAEIDIGASGTDQLSVSVVHVSEANLCT